MSDPVTRCPHCSFDPTSLNDYCELHRPMTVEKLQRAELARLTRELEAARRERDTERQRAEIYGDGIAEWRPQIERLRAAEALLREVEGMVTDFGTRELRARLAAWLEETP